MVIQDNLSPEKHVNKIFASTYRTLTNIRVAFNHIDMDMMRKIITTVIRPKLEYAGVIWSRHKKKRMKKQGRLQRMATKMVPELEGMTNEED